MKTPNAYFQEKFATLTPDQIARILKSDMEDHFMRYGRKIIVHVDTSMELMNLYTIEDIEGVFPSKEAATEKAKELFIANAAFLRKLYIYAISETDSEGRKTYTEGLRGIGQQFGWWSVYGIEEAKWFYSLEDVMEHIKRHGVLCGPLSVEAVPVHTLYHKLTGKHL